MSERSDRIEESLNHGACLYCGGRISSAAHHSVIPHLREVGDEHGDPDETNNPTIAVHAEAAKFGVTLTSTSAAYIAEAAIVASGLRPRVWEEHEEARESEELQAKLSASWNDGYNTAKHIYAQSKAETAADIVAKIRAHCTPSAEAYRLGGDRLIAAVADWVESPPEWVDASWFRRPLPIQGDAENG